MANIDYDLFGWRLWPAPLVVGPDGIGQNDEADTSLSPSPNSGSGGEESLLRSSPATIGSRPGGGVASEGGRPLSQSTCTGSKKGRLRRKRDESRCGDAS